MLIVCPSCASEYTIDPEKLGADGRTVRCAICRDTWFVSPEGASSPNVSISEMPGEPDAPTDDMAIRPVPPPDPKPHFRLRPALALLVALALGLSGWAMWKQHARLEDILGDRLAQVRQILDRVVAYEAGLGFQNIAADLIGQDRSAVLVVTGEIVNGTGREFEVPHLEILVRSEDEKVLTARTDPPPQPSLGPGEAVRFTMRFPSPPPDARQVRVQFTTVGGIAVAVHSPSF